jgi:hypothetical protein
MLLKIKIDFFQKVPGLCEHPCTAPDAALQGQA